MSVNDDDTTITSAIAAEPEEHLTAEERAHMKQTLISKMVGLQELLQTYKEQHQQLQDEVREFVLRDVDEQNAMYKIASRVDDQQREALNNPEYLRWAATNGKGEFEESQENRDGEHGPPLILEEGKASSMIEHLRRQPSSKSAGVSLVSSLEFPDTIVFLDEFGQSLTSVLRGFRQRSTATNEQLEALTTRLLSPRDGTEVDNLLLVVNGCPALASGLYSQEAATATFSEQQNARHGGGGVVYRDAAASALWWWSLMLSSSAVNSPPSLVNMLTTSPTALQALQDDDNVISLISLSRVRNSVVVRAFVIDAVLKAIEVCDLQVDVLTQAFGSQAEERLKTLCQSTLLPQILSQLSSAAQRRLVVTALVCAPSLDDAETGAVGMRLIVTDVRGLSPQVPFRWYFTWQEVCGLGKYNHEEVVVKRARVKAAALTPSDDLSQVWFPLINRQLGEEVRGSVEADAQDVVQGPTSSISTTHRRQDRPGGVSVGVLVGGSIVIAALSVASTLLLSSRHTRK